MENRIKPDNSNAKQLPESRQSEIAYHKKLNIGIAIIAAPIFLAMAAFQYYLHNNLLAFLFFSIVIDETVGVVLALRSKTVPHLVRLKLISSVIAFMLLATAFIIGMLGDQIYLTLPWIFLIPSLMLLFFGPRMGFYGAAAFSLAMILILLWVGLPPWSAFSTTIFKINAVASLMAMFIISAMAQSLRARIQKELLGARNRSHAAEQLQRQANVELKNEIDLRLQSENRRSHSEMRYRQLFEESAVPMREEDWSGVKEYINALPLDAAEDLKAYLKQSPNALTACTALIQVTAVNRAMLSLYEADTAEKLPRGIVDIFPPNAEVSWIDQIVSLYRQGRYDAVTTARTLGGRHLDLLIKIAIPSEFMPSWRKVFISVYDITQQVALEHANKRVANQLLRSRRVQAVATLAGGIAHQFNNGLAVIQGNLDLIKFKTQLDALNQKIVNSLQTSIHRMGRLTDQLLAYAQGGKYQPRRFSINDLIEETLSSKSLPHTAAIRVQTHLAPHVCFSKGDKLQIQMVIEAILINAYESMPDGGELTITTCQREIVPAKPANSQHEADMNGALGTYALLIVEDTGVGMDTDTRERIFEPFFTTKFSGRGMGMASAYGIVRNHGGFIQVTSTPRRGTCISVYLPCEQERTYSSMP